MANSRPRPLIALAVAVALLSAVPSPAQQPTQGFAVERFYPSAPGGGWFVMDDLDISGGLGGAISLTGGYGRNPFEVSSPGGARRVDLVSGESFVDLGLAVTYDRFRVYLNLPMPLTVTGNSGTVGPYQLAAPSLNIGANPDTISDPRLGFDTRLYGKPGGPLRLGGGAQLFFPAGNRADYVSDGRYRAMFRFLAAGDAGHFTYAGQFGVHLRPVEGGIPPGGPNGNELLFGAAAGRRFTVHSDWDAVIGPEFFGESVVHSNYMGQTGFEGLLTTRLERTGVHPNYKSHLRFKAGIGHSLVHSFGAPQWRVVVGVEFGAQHTSNSTRGN